VDFAPPRWNGVLANPSHDAEDISAKLAKLGFQVVSRTDLKIGQIGGALREFRSKLYPGGVALVFYAGHGLQIKGENYFLSVDADILTEEDVPNQSLSMRQIFDVLDDSKAGLSLNLPRCLPQQSSRKGLWKFSGRTRKGGRPNDGHA
jgi:hypothetical protein